jgi:hypothetical protein
MTGKSTQTRFHSAREAKAFLASQIFEQAQRDHVQLSIVEQKMLYFSETDWTLPDMSTISQEFDRAYDQDQYEEKVTTLVRHAYKRALKGPRDDYENWWSAIRRLRSEDHYVLVMIRLAGLRPRWDQLKLLGAGVFVAVLWVCFVFLSIYLRTRHGVLLDKYMPSSDNLEFLYWAIPACLLVGYCLLRLLVGEKRVDDLLARPLIGLGRFFNRSN